jgi:tetratricopeptide (TPR) repeat protein
MLLVKRRLAFIAAALWLGFGAQTKASDIYYKAGPLGHLMGSERPACQLTLKPDPAGQPPCIPPKPDPRLSDKERIGVLISRAEFLCLISPDLALAELKEALGIDPSSAAAWHFSARYKMTFGNRGEALADVAKALMLDPSDSNIWATKGSLQTNSSDALRDFAAALSLDPTNLFALTNRIFLNESLRDAVALNADIAALAAIQPEHPMLAGRKVEAAAQAGDSAAAIAKLTAQLDKDPGSMTLLLERAGLLQGAGDNDGAVRDLSAILGSGDEAPRYAIGGSQAAGLYFARAISLNALKRGPEAKSDVERALRAADTRLLLRIQVFLWSKGYSDVDITGTLSSGLIEAASACMLNPACGRGITSRI